METILAWTGGWIGLIGLIVVSATVVTMLTPTPTDDRILSRILRVVSLIAGNVGKNANADALLARVNTASAMLKSGGASGVDEAINKAGGDRQTASAIKSLVHALPDTELRKALKVRREGE